MRSVVLGLLMLAIPFTAHAAEEGGEYDVVVYGGTSAGVAAAVQAARMDRSVVLVSPAGHLGGLSSSGLGKTDSGRPSAVGGVSREFYRRIHDHYEKDAAWTREKSADFKPYDPEDETMWRFEPHVAEGVFEDLVAEAGVPVVRDAWLDREDGVKLDGGRIVSITTLDGATYRGKMFIDATYEGDLMAAAGVSYTVGRESNAKYGETLNGVQPNQMKYHLFVKQVSPYVEPGDPSSGLLPRVHAGGPGEKGSGDRRIQAYCFRTCMTDVPENRVDWPRPDGYDPMRYELLLRNFDAGDDRKRGMLKIDRMPNRKTDTNNRGPFSTDNIGMNYAYPEASYEQREQIVAEHERYQKGLMWTLAHNERVPKKIREKVRAWGLAADEFEDNGNWPYKIYVREARRMLGAYVMSEQDIRRTRKTPEPIGLGSYNMDSHNTQRYVTAEGYVQNEGDVQVGPGGPYRIAYPAITPKKSECENLLVPVCASASHIAYGSIRMEPVFMILGQSAATAASHAIEESAAVQEIDYARLRKRLLADGQVLTPRGGMPAPKPAKNAGGRIDPAELAGVVVDDDQAQRSGGWTASTSTRPFVGEGYRHDGDASSKKTARFRAELPEAGRYEVRLAYPAHRNRAARAKAIIHHADGEKTVRVDQRKPGRSGGGLRSLGTYRFEADRPAEVVVSNEGAEGYVVIDAVQFVPAEQTNGN